MAVTGNIFKELIFDGVSSRNYGVYITGEAVYNAPERDVEMIKIPGRNGSFALDHGRFENITVTYPAGIYADNETEFAQIISDFRNLLCSKKGYCRLSDGYHPDEYRMAVYKSGLEVDPVQLKAGEFNIVFDCKPQRFLANGEAKVTMTSGGTITNPTLFESAPLLEVEGYGTIEFNGYEIEIENSTIGIVELAPEAINRSATILDRSNLLLLNDGDDISIESGSIHILHIQAVDISSMENLSMTGSLAGGIQGAQLTLTQYKPNGNVVYGYDAKITFPAYVFHKGTAEDLTDTLSGTISYTDPDTNNTVTLNYSYGIVFSYGIGSTTQSISTSHTGTNPSGFYLNNLGGDILRRVEGDSTKLLTEGLKIDCDIGEAYKVVDGEPVSLNHYIDLGSKLPTLATGVNTMTFDNTFTEIKVVPRWWKI